VTTIAAHIDSMVVLSRQMAAEGMYPAIDPIASSSVLLDPLVVGEEHVAVATEVRRNIEHYRELQDVISLLGIEELGAEDRRVVERARRLQRFFTQPFAVTEAFSGVPGAPSLSLTRLPAARRSSPANATRGRKARFTWSAQSTRRATRRKPRTPLHNPRPSARSKRPQHNERHPSSHCDDAVANPRRQRRCRGGAGRGPERQLWDIARPC
jgi:hypothetical protein